MLEEIVMNGDMRERQARPGLRASDAMDAD